MSNDPDHARSEGLARELDAAVSPVEQRLAALPDDAAPSAVTAALDGTLAPLAHAAKEALR